MHLILYSKPGCHLCEGLQEKLEQLQGLSFDLEVRDITTRSDWFEAYQYEIPVLCQQVEPDQSSPETAHAPLERILPRLSPRASLEQVEQTLRRHLQS